MAILFFSGFFLYTSAYMGHPETLVLLFSLLGLFSLKKEKYYSTGLLFGLAFAAKQSAFFIFFPILIFLFFKKNNLRNFAKVTLGSIFSSVTVFLPFLIKDFNNTWYEIFVQNQKLIINGPNFWWLLDAFIQKGFGLKNINEILVSIANPILFLIIAVTSVFLVVKNNINKTDDQFFGLIAFSVMLSFLFSKWLSLHHLLLGFVFIIIWDTLRTKGFPTFAVYYSLVLMVSYSSNNPLWQFMVLLTNIIALVYIFSLLFAKRAAFRYLKKTYDEKIK